MNMGRNAIGYGLVGLSALALAGCAAIPTPEAPSQPPPIAAAPPPPVTAPMPARAWDERVLDGGNWRYDAGKRTAAFVPAGGTAPLLAMTCASGSIRLTSGLGASGQPTDVDLKTSAGTDRIRFDGGAASLPARDPRLDRIAFSRGRFALEAVGGGTLTLPVQSEIGRLIEDCRG
jgi:hypothetical protein